MHFARGAGRVTLSDVDLMMLRHVKKALENLLQLHNKLRAYCLGGSRMVLIAVVLCTRTSKLSFLEALFDLCCT